MLRRTPDLAKVSTMRMGMRRFLAHAVALHYMHYNFAREHQTLQII